jgi:transposase InsO family protein
MRHPDQERQSRRNCDTSASHTSAERARLDRARLVCGAGRAGPLTEAALQFIATGKPMQNAFAERFVGRLRDECLNEHWFTGLADARRTVEAWRRDHNAVRPHSSLGERTPTEARQAHAITTATLPPPAGLSQ